MANEMERAYFCTSGDKKDAKYCQYHSGRFTPSRERDDHDGLPAPFETDSKRLRNTLADELDIGVGQSRFVVQGGDQG